MDQEIVGVLSENASLLEEKRNQESDTAWEQRYQELLGK